MDQKASSLPSTQSENEVLHAIRQTILYFIQICNALLFCIIAAHWLWNRRYKGRQSEVLPSTTVACSQEDEQNAQLSAEDYHVSRISYSEDTIINIISDIYRVYLQLNYISDWEMSWAPKEGHPIKQAICEELHLDHVVVSLMKRLPYFRFSGISDDIEFIHPYSRAFVYLEESELRGGRDPDRFTFEKPRPDFLLPWEIALTCSMDEGIHLILDTKENAIRVWSFNEAPPGDDDNYRNYYSHHAPTYLANYLQQLKSLEIIPGASRYPRSLYNKHYTEIYPKIKKILQEQYGWPYEFREAQWKTVAKVTWKRIDLDDPEYDTDNEDELEPEVLKNGGDHWSCYLRPHIDFGGDDYSLPRVI